MRIAFVTFEYPPFVVGGAGVYAKHITEELSKLGHDVVVFSPSAKKSFKEFDITVESLPTSYRVVPKAFQFWLKLPKALRKIDRINKFDIIHFNGFSYFFLQKRLLNCPHFLTVHHLISDAIEYGHPSLLTRFLNLKGENSFIMPLFEKWAVESADKIIAVSNFTKNQLFKRYRLDNGKIDVIYNGNDINLISFNESDLNTVRNNYHLLDKPIILFVGRVDDPRKGLDILLKAFKQVLEQTDAILLVVGGGSSEFSKNITRALGISQHVIFTGFVDSLTLKKIYTLCSLYVCPSRLEGFGLTLLEAMIVKKPIVATNVGAIPEIMRNYKFGVLVKSGDVGEIADAIIKCLIDKKHFGIVESKNTIYSDHDFSWKKNVIQLEILYNKSLRI